MGTRVIALLLICVHPSVASAGPLLEAIERAGREAVLAQQPEPAGGRSSRFWTGLALLAGGGVLIVLGALEVGDDEDDPAAEDDEDNDDSDDGEDGDAAHAVMLGGGIGAAALGGVLMLTGRSSGPVSPRRTGIVAHYTVRF